MLKLLTIVAEPDQFVSVPDCNDMSAVQRMMDSLYRIAVYEDLRSVWLIRSAIKVQRVIEKIRCKTCCTIYNMKAIIGKEYGPLVDLDIALHDDLIQPCLDIC